MPDTNMDILTIHPGETLAELMIDRGIAPARLAKETGVPENEIQSVINGKALISKPFASALEKIFGVPESFWNNLVANYEAEKNAAGNPPENGKGLSE